MKFRYFFSASSGNCSRQIACSSTYIRWTGSAATSCVSKLKVLDNTLNAKRVEMPSIPSSTPAASRYSCTDFARGSVSFRLSPSYTRIFEYRFEFSWGLSRDSTLNRARISKVDGAQGELASSLFCNSFSYILRSSVARKQYGTLITEIRSMNASLFLLFLKLCHSASFECAKTMP